MLRSRVRNCSEPWNHHHRLSHLLGFEANPWSLDGTVEWTLTNSWDTKNKRLRDWHEVHWGWISQILENAKDIELSWTSHFGTLLDCQLFGRGVYLPSGSPADMVGLCQCWQWMALQWSALWPWTNRQSFGPILETHPQEVDTFLLKQS